MPPEAGIYGAAEAAPFQRQSLPLKQNDQSLEAECPDVGGVGWERHGLEVHGAHAVVGAE